VQPATHVTRLPLDVATYCAHTHTHTHTHVICKDTHTYTHARRLYVESYICISRMAIKIIQCVLHLISPAPLLAINFYTTNRTLNGLSLSLSLSLSLFFFFLSFREDVHMSKTIIYGDYLVRLFRLVFYPSQISSSPKLSMFSIL